MSSSLLSHRILAAKLAGRRTGMDPWMQVLCAIFWSLFNLVVIVAIVTTLTLVLRPHR